MTTSAGILDGTYIKSKSAWLITWDWTGEHARVENRFVAVLDYRYSSNTIARLVEQLYVTCRFALSEQLAYARRRKYSPYRVQYGVVNVAEEARAKADLPSTIPFSDSMICGSNPWLWARIVYDIEAYTDEDGNEHLCWKERLHTTLRDGRMESECEDRSLIICG
jgi:hypothetical protein